MIPLRRHRARCEHVPWARWLGSATAGLAIGIASGLGASPAGAAVPEPDHLFYGVVLEGGSALQGTAVELRLGDASGELLARGHTGSGTAASDLYLLTVAVESPETVDEPRRPGVARAGDLATLLVSGAPAAQLVVGGRGLFARVDIDLQSAGSLDADEPGGDLDGDGVPNYLDNCFLGNASQSDANGDGVGDACEGLTNAAPAYLDVEAPSGGNIADPSTGLGAVEYPFQVADTEVTNAQYAAMLAAVADGGDPQGLYNPLMASDPRGGIRRTGSPGAFEYVLKPSMANKPVNFVSWLDAARYTNWLFNGSPVGPPGPATTETGAFDLAVPDPATGAVPELVVGYSMPTEHEWYKAAYFDPELDAYWIYPTRSDSEPLPALADGVGDVSNPGPERVNYASAADWNGLDGNVTSAGSAGALSPYGASDMAGNVWEWTAADAETGQRVVRGGSFLDDRFSIEASADGRRELLLREPAYEGADVGMRLAFIETTEVPEPGSTLGLGAGALLLVQLARRRRRAAQRRESQREEAPSIPG